MPSPWSRTMTCPVSPSPNGEDRDQSGRAGDRQGGHHQGLAKKRSAGPATGYPAPRHSAPIHRAEYLPRELHYAEDLPIDHGRAPVAYQVVVRGDPLISMQRNLEYLRSSDQSTLYPILMKASSRISDE